MSGCFIAVEGLDGSGGTTQVEKLAHRIGGAHITAEPSSGPIGHLIKQALRGEVALADGLLPLLFAADRKDHLDREILPRLAEGQVVITDRYYASSLAYQSLSAPFDEVARLNEAYRAPDLTLFLDLSPEDCLARIEARGEAKERFETMERLSLIAASYGATLAFLGSRGESIFRVDASGTPEEIHAQIWEAVAPCLP